MSLLKQFSFIRKTLLVLASAGLSIGSVDAQQSIMAAGDSITAGFNRPSFRLPLLDSLSDYGCPVSMVGDQTLNTFDFRDPPGPGNGSNFPGFTAPTYDIDHQAFPALTTDGFADGVSSSFYTVNPISSYISATNPDFVLLHLGSNDLGARFFGAGGFSTDTDINNWSSSTVIEMRRAIDNIIAGHNTPSDLRILVANFIPYADSNRSDAQLVQAKRASALYTLALESMVLDRADSRVVIVDVETGFDPATMTIDGLHPNAVGEQHMAGAFLPVLRGAGLCPNTPTLTSPAPGESVSGASTVIQWNDNGLAVSSWRVRVGNTQSGSSSTYFDSGNLPAATRQVSVPLLPADQRNLFVSLQYTAAGGTDQIMSSFINRAAAGAQGIPAMSRPIPGSELSGSSVNFSWESNDADNIRWWYVRVGSTLGGGQYYDSGRITESSTRAVSVTGLPTDGSPVYFELSANDGNWAVQNFVYRAAGSGIPEKVLAPSQWHQFSLAYNPGSNNTVSDIFGDVLPVGTYVGPESATGNWTVIALDVDESSQQNDAYRTLDLNDQMRVGQGYWVLHLLPEPVTLSVPAGATANSSNVNAAQRAACENPGRCYAVPVNAQPSSARTSRFVMLGYPLDNPTSALQVRVNTAGNIGCSGTRDCSLGESGQKGLLTDNLFVWDPNLGSGGDYRLIGPLEGVLNPWEGFFAAQESTVTGQSPVLVMSEPTP